MALAGFSKEDIEVVVEDGTITVKSVFDDKVENAEVLHRVSRRKNSHVNLLLLTISK